MLAKLHLYVNKYSMFRAVMLLCMCLLHWQCFTTKFTYCWYTKLHGNNQC